MTFNHMMDHNFIKLGQLNRLFKTQLFVNTSEFKAIVDNEFDVNYQLPPDSLLSQNKPECSGNTALHFITSFFRRAINYPTTLLFEYLVKLGADSTITNDKGYTPLLQAFYKNRNVESILLALFKTNNSNNVQCKNGVSHFHIACSVRIENLSEAVKIVDFYLKAGAPVNQRINDDSPEYSGYTPLHFASKHGQVEMIKLLLKNGANINSLDTNRITPLQMLIEYSMNKSGWDIDIQLQKCLMEAAYYNQHDDIRLWILHLECILCSSSSEDQIFNQKFHVDTFIKFDSTICPGYTPLHLASHYNLKTVRLLLLKGANLLAKDAKGITPFDICLKKFKINEIIEILTIEKRHSLSELKFADGTNLLDVLQAMTVEDEFEQYISCNLKNINTVIPLQSVIWPGYSILHLGVLFDCCVSNLLSHKADLTMLNMDGLSPLHLAFYMGTDHEKTMRELVSSKWEHCCNPKNFNNPVDRNNLSHLHIVCTEPNNDKEYMARFLLLKGANPNLPLLADVHTDYHNRYRSDSCSFLEKGSTSLHIAARTGHSCLIRNLLVSKANLHVANAYGVTPFQIALNEYKYRDDKINFATILTWMLKIDLETWTTGAMGLKILHDVLTDSYRPDGIVKALIQEFDKKKPYEKLGITRLQVACCIGDLTMVQEELKSGVDVNQCISSDSSIWPGDSAMHILFRENPQSTNEITELLFSYGGNPTLKNASNLTPIHICKDKILPMAISLLASKNFTSVNPVNNIGLSHFHLCCRISNVLVVKEFLKFGVNINAAVDYFAENYAGWTPLHFAICYANEEVVKLLLDHGADDKITNANGLSPLHQALSSYLKFDNLNRVEMITRHPKINIQNMNIFGETILMSALKSNMDNENIIDLLLNIGAQMNLRWFTTENLRESNLIFQLVSKFSPKMFQRLIILIPAITSIDDMGRNAFHYFSLKAGFLRGSKIFNKNYCKSNFEILMENGCELDQKDNEGKTALHEASCNNYNQQALFLLLELGADVNMKSDTGKTPITGAYDDYCRILIEQLQKLEELDLYLEESNKTYLKNYNSSRSALSIKIKKEMKILDNFLKDKISKSFDVHYFFTEDFVVKYRRMQASQRQELRNLYNFHDLYKLVPNLFDLINRQLRKACTRTRLFKSAQFAFYKLPDLCIEFIFDYLSNEDLMNVIRAWNGKLEFAELPNNC